MLMEMVTFLKVKSSLSWKFFSKILKGWESRQFGNRGKALQAEGIKVCRSPKAVASRTHKENINHE